MGQILITGAEGFVGQALCKYMRNVGHFVTGVSRRESPGTSVSIGNIADYDDWLSLLEGMDVVVHLSARAHVLNETARDPLEEFRRVNVTPTVRLAQAAVVANVKRVVFVSSIGVNGAETSSRPFNEIDQPNPLDFYALSKFEAEKCLREIEQSSGLEVAVIRPPLIYGPGVKGNFLRLLGLVDSRIPLPLGAVCNCRSFIGLQNLCGLLAVCAVHSAAAGETFLAADGDDLSTPELLRMIAQAMGRPLWLPRIPLGLLRRLARIAGRGADLDRLTRSLQVDASRAQAVVGWQPETSLREGIGEMADWYLSRKRK